MPTLCSGIAARIVNCSARHSAAPQVLQGVLSGALSKRLGCVALARMGGEGVQQLASALHGPVQRRPLSAQVRHVRARVCVLVAAEQFITTHGRHGCTSPLRCPTCTQRHLPSRQPWPPFAKPARTRTRVSALVRCRCADAFAAGLRWV